MWHTEHHEEAKPLTSYHSNDPADNIWNSMVWMSPVEQIATEKHFLLDEHSSMGWQNHSLLAPSELPVNLICTGQSDISHIFPEKFY